ncbi:alpha/beta hydrolase [Actinokineospora soli]|uniref:Alpha/beta hydrolase n=1 Tax=Actinokineospora soli TaxID=1048753 RepID=A0ABW2TMV3_9PSEU
MAERLVQRALHELARAVAGTGRGRRPGVGGILLVNETFDAATPFSGALEVRDRFPGAVLVEGAGGTTHASSLSGGACVDALVARYLKTGELPARRPGKRADVRCDPLPQPTPTGADS